MNLGINAVVLLSGGMDSVAAACWAQPRYMTLRAIWFDYGQPNRDQEDICAGKTASTLGIERTRVVLADALRPVGLLNKVPAHDSSQLGIHKAFVPGRNILFLLIAAAHANGWFPAGTIDLVIGCCKEDASGFPDCRTNTLSSLNDTLNRGMAREYRIRTPWIDRSKSQILYAIKMDPRAVTLVSHSYSCYEPDGPCGKCTPCVLRKEAFQSQSLTDSSALRPTSGGDPSRDLPVGATGG